MPTTSSWFNGETYEMDNIVKKLLRLISLTPSYTTMFFYSYILHRVFDWFVSSVFEIIDMIFVVFFKLRSIIPPMTNSRYSSNVFTFINNIIWWKSVQLLQDICQVNHHYSPVLFVPCLARIVYVLLSLDVFVFYMFHSLLSLGLLVLWCLGWG